MRGWMTDLQYVSVPVQGLQRSGDSINVSADMETL